MILKHHHNAPMLYSQAGKHDQILLAHGSFMQELSRGRTTSCTWSWQCFGGLSQLCERGSHTSHCVLNGHSSSYLAPKSPIDVPSSSLILIQRHQQTTFKRGVSSDDLEDLETRNRLILALIVVRGARSKLAEYNAQRCFSSSLRQRMAVLRRATLTVLPAGHGAAGFGGYIAG